VKEKEEMAENKEQRIGAKKFDQREKSSVCFQTAFAKYWKGDTLTRENLVALINKTKLPNVPPNRNNLRDLAQQWHEQKHRLDENLGDIPVQDNNPAVHMELLDPIGTTIDDVTTAIVLYYL
jgi:hypothetical protein